MFFREVTMGSFEDFALKNASLGVVSNDRGTTMVIVIKNIYNIVKILALSVVLFLLPWESVLADPPPRTCEPIRIELCRDLGYNDTSMPNLIGHELQADADLQLQTFTPLIQYRCSSRLKFFLCSVYVPMCTEKVPQPIGPCRPFCESVKGLCHPVLHEFGFPWPPALNCSKFPPENNHLHMCMEGPGEEAGVAVAQGLPIHSNPDSGTSPQQPVDNVPANSNNNNPPWNPYTPAKSKSLGVSAPAIPPSNPVAPAQQPSQWLCSQFRQSNKYYFINRTERCAHLCDAHILFTKDDKHFAEIWMAVWAIACFLSTLFTVLTFVIDSGRFRYPERSIIFLSLCYNLYSIGYLVRLVAGRETIACHMDNQHGVKILSQDGLENTSCAIVFFLLYYFGTATAVWWLVLTVTWFLAAGLNWEHETLQRHSSIFHLVAWCVPAAMTITLIVTRRLDADELTGVCYVGNQSTDSLISFVLVPQLVFLVVGMSFLLAGFLSIFRARAAATLRFTTPPNKSPSKTNKLKVLMVRIGMFTVLYIIPAICIVSILFYEYLNRDTWLKVPLTGPTPNLEVFMLKVFMSLVVGITSGMWIWSAKTLEAWKRLGQRATRKKQPLPPYLQPSLTHLPASSATSTHATVPLVPQTGSNGVVGTNVGIPRHSSRSSNRCKRSHRRWGSETIV